LKTFGGRLRLLPALRAGTASVRMESSADRSRRSTC